MYEGSWKSGKKDGKGILQYENGDRYEGQMKDDKRDGAGVMHYAGGDKFVGGWDNDRYQGKGKLMDRRGRVIRVGEWNKNSFDPK